MPKVELTDQEWQLARACIAKQPFEAVFQLMLKIDQQLAAQMPAQPRSNGDGIWLKEQRDGEHQGS